LHPLLYKTSDILTFNFNADTKTDQCSTFVTSFSAETEWLLCCAFCPKFGRAIPLNSYSAKDMKTINLFSRMSHWIHPYSFMPFSDTAYSEASQDLCQDWTRFDPKKCRWWKVIADSVDEVMQAKGFEV